jgi:hypothetical protein
MHCPMLSHPNPNPKEIFTDNTKNGQVGYRSVSLLNWPPRSGSAIQDYESAAPDRKEMFSVP